MGCKALEEKPISLAVTHYYPLEICKKSSYMVTEYSHEAFREKTDTTTYLQKEILEDTFTDIYSSLVNKIAISVSKESGKNWIFDSNSILENDDNSAVRTKNNARKIVLSFPLRECKTWDVIVFNNQDVKTAIEYNLDKSASTVLGRQYAKSVWLDLCTQIDPILTNVENEGYENLTGLIERRYSYMETQPGKNKNGIEYVKTIYETNLD